jgi:hypothetical protein
MSGPSTAVRKARDPAGTRSFPLWFGTLGPPLAWGAHLLLGDALYELGCSPGFTVREIYGLPFQFWALLQTGLLLAVDVAAGLLALWAHRLLRRGASGENDTRHGRAEGMAVAGMASSVIYGLLLIYGLVPTFFLDACGVTP